MILRIVVDGAVRREFGLTQEITKVISYFDVVCYLFFGRIWL